MSISETRLSFTSSNAYLSILGANERYLNLFENSFNVKIQSLGSDIIIHGDKEKAFKVQEVFNKLTEMLEKHENVDKTCIKYAIALAKQDRLDCLDELIGEVVATTFKGRTIKCKTLNQLNYVKSIKNHPLTIAIGPAGSGKTYLAMALAIVALRNKEVERIVLTRPAVEAGEKLGFLPGDLSQKVDPYLRPLYDALFEFMGPEAYHSLTERGILEIAPLAYMRGRTLSDSYIILDEAQNTTKEQMKMFLTRMGAHSKVVVTGDITQTDLPSGKQSGLVNAVNILKDIKDIALVKLEEEDIVRNDLVQQIVHAYETQKR